MKISNLKKAILAMSLGLGLSGAFVGTAVANHASCPTWQQECMNTNDAWSCNQWFRYCRDRPLP